MNLLRPGRGYLQDVEDARDRMLGVRLAASTPPLTASVRHPLVNPRNQGSTNSCVGFAWAQAVRLAYLAQGVACPDLSPLFVYYLARAETQTTIRDDGTRIRDAAKATKRLGISSEKGWPFGRLRVNKRPGLPAHHDAFDRRGVRGYFRIASGDLDGIRRAIASGFPVVAGWTIDKPFMDPDGPAVVDSLDGAPVGGHAMVVEDYDEATFGILGSWPKWRDGGRCRMTEDVVAQAHDVWAVDVEV